MIGTGRYDEFLLGIMSTMLKRVMEQFVSEFLAVQDTDCTR